MNIQDFAERKTKGPKISMVTCYDHWSAKIISESEIDTILIGDSVSMVVYGHPTTLNATTEMIARHVEAVSRGAPNKFLIADMPFPSFRMGVTESMRAVDLLMKAGAHAVKIEGVEGHEDVIEHIVKSGVPVMGHLGLTPQSIHQLGGFKVQGRTEAAVEIIIQQAQRLQTLGVFGLVLECIPSYAGSRITKAVQVPTIGIGAGPHTDGQVLVLQDLLGMNNEFKPKFVRQYFSGFKNIREALNSFVSDVHNSKYPNETESYS